MPPDRSFLLNDFVAAVANVAPEFDCAQIDFSPCDHHHIVLPPRGRALIHLFWREETDRYLKIGKAGPNSQMRIYHHYSVNAAQSTLAKSILDEYQALGVLPPAPPADVRDWIIVRHASIPPWFCPAPIY